MILYLCLSSHGYGHISRQSAVITELHRLVPKWRIVISSTINTTFIDILFKNIKIEKRYFCWDIGMVQTNALFSDLEETEIAIKKLNHNLDEKILSEAYWINSQNDEVIILADIPPSAADLAEVLNAPLVWMGNFGWDDIYKPLGGFFKSIVPEITDKYSHGNLLLRCPFSLDMNWGLPEVKLDLVASKPQPLDDRFKLIVSSLDKPLICLAFGGLGYQINNQLLEMWNDYYFIILRPFQDKLPDYTLPNNVINHPTNIRLVDIIPYCSRLIGKPGFSTFCECMSQNVGIHAVERIDFAEAKVLLDGLKMHGFSRLLDKSSFESGDWQLDKALNQPLSALLPTDGAIEAANSIITLM